MTNSARRCCAVVPRRQHGNFLLEAMIGVLIVAFGILGLIGLQAKTMQNVSDTEFRAEAAFLANSYIGQMWTSDQTPAVLIANFSSAGGGAAYTEFSNFVALRLPNATGANAPVVTVAQTAPATSFQVTVTVFWHPSGDVIVHNYTATAVVGEN